MSRAVVTCCSAGRPFGLMKCVCSMPIGAAVWFISLDERGLVAAERLGDRDGEVVGRAHDQCVQRVAQRDVLADLEAEAGRRLACACGEMKILVSFVDLVIAHRLEGDVGRHHLGERGRVPAGIDVLGVEDVPIVDVEQDRPGRERGPRAERARKAPGKGAGQHDLRALPKMFRPFAARKLIPPPRHHAAACRQMSAQQAQGHCNPANWQISRQLGVTACQQTDPWQGLVCSSVSWRQQCSRSAAPS